MAVRVDSALPQTCYPAVWLWPGHGLYAGPSLDLGHHSGSVWCLVLGVDRELTVTANGRSVAARSALIPPRMTHKLDTRGGRLVSCYLDPSSGRATACRDLCHESPNGVFVDHDAQRTLTAIPSDADHARRWIEIAAPVSAHPMNHRITLAVKRIRSSLPESPSLRDLAVDASLSESRFLQLFRQEAGTSLRRYRSWSRLLRVGLGVSAGLTLTDAAAEAGFASPSHLSDTFKATFGLTASQLLASGTALHVATD
ncbi:AraC family transcriptional regulator [Candidatus Mycobacterium wuenschmannii]|uniref:AraC family transcriptional regulator n=1 Tax=Candidatus Mycobacterium wuenschmannii TaxID=3027808 RepID=A0ABY8VTV0_9MYCO|nr:AraC family transcriptional regulator [Candidatus Mycobacterium wuenschmannii]WIM86731.1 AraC family transcriptional regulator [Candidatus Mycobacterium wuenschmannii]